MDERPDCRRCRYYFITHDPRFPNGCRAFGVKGRRLPSVEVREASGRECAAFEGRPAPAERRGPGDERTQSLP